jgi:hypothetical protein
MAPDLPPRALPAAWRLLQANELNHAEPCDFNHHGDCQTAGHSWCGETAHELRRECGVRCLTELVPRVIEAEQHAEAHRTEARARRRAGHPRRSVVRAARRRIRRARIRPSAGDQRHVAH